MSRPASRAASRAPSMAPTNSRGASPVYDYNSPAGSRGSTPMSFSSEYTSRRSPSPYRTAYTDVLCTASRRLRERSIPPPPPPPQRYEPVRAPVPLGSKPPIGPPRVVASDFYKGRVKSIYEREPLFNDFARTIPQRYGPTLNIYNSSVLNTVKHDFKDMIEDSMTRKTLKDPGVGRDFGTKAYPWRDTLAKEREPASSRIYRSQEARRAGRGSTPVNMPRVYVYHRSTMSPAPNC